MAARCLAGMGDVAQTSPNGLKAVELSLPIPGYNSSGMRIKSNHHWESIWPTAALLAPSLALLVAFALSLAGITHESIWMDESWSLWAVRDGWLNLWQRIADDVHPPLYFLLLHGWTLAVGETPLAVRYLSAGIGLLALAITYALAQRLFDRATALVALLWLGSSGLWVYYTRETRMYTLVIALATLSFWFYAHWLVQPRSRRALLMLALTNGMLLYAHYAAFFLISAQVAYLLLTQPRQLFRFLQGAMLTALCYLPWFPMLLHQVTAHPNGLNQTLVTVDRAIFSELLYAYTGGVGLLLLLPYLFRKEGGNAHWSWRRHLLLLLWVLLPPLLMLALNTWGIAIYEVRYVIGVLPAMALLTAYGIRHVKWPPLALLFLCCFVGANLWSLRWARPAKPPWDATLRAVMATRQPDEPTLLALVEARGPESYYANLLGLPNEQTVDLTPLRHQPDAVRAAVERLAAASSIWVIMPTNIAATWQVIAALDQTHGVTYRATVDYMLFYRFTRNAGASLTLHFDDLLLINEPLFVERNHLAPGTRYCRQLHLRTVADLPPLYSLGLHLVDGANRLVAQQDQGLAAIGADSLLTPTFCLVLPADLKPGVYALHLVFYRWDDGARMALYERTMPWGDAIILDTMKVE